MRPIWLLLVLSLSSACMPAGGAPAQDELVCGEEAAEEEATEEPEAQPVHEVQAAPELGTAVALFPDALALDPAPELLPFVQESARRYRERFDLNIEIVKGGIPMGLEDHVMWRGSEVDAVASYQRLCVFSACNSKIASVVFARPLLAEKSWAMQQSMDHEIGHIVSGWGSAAKMPQHFAEPGHLMSPGCVNHVCAPWTSEDATMLCAGAPCTKVELP